MLKPDLEGLFRAAREVGLRKIKREEHVSHPKRPHGKEGRLWVSASGAKESIGAGSKEELLQLIGGQWRQMQRNARQEVVQQVAKGQKQGTVALDHSEKTPSNAPVSRNAPVSKALKSSNMN